MAEKNTFDERVKNVIVDCAVLYKKYFVDYEYLLCSDGFTNLRYYIVDACEDNYKHLTGVNSALSAAEFFDKCIHKTLNLCDFNYVKRWQGLKATKGSVRRKITVLPELVHLFDGDVMVEEDFQKNRVCCAFAAGKKAFTVGFHVTGKARPMTLLKGYELDSAKAKPIGLILRRKSGSDKFDEIVVGGIMELVKYQASISMVLSDVLLTRIREREVLIALLGTMEFEIIDKTARNAQIIKILLTFHPYIARILHIFQNKK